MAGMRNSRRQLDESAEHEGMEMQVMVAVHVREGEPRVAESL